MMVGSVGVGTFGGCGPWARTASGQALSSSTSTPSTEKSLILHVSTLLVVYVASHGANLLSLYHISPPSHNVQNDRFHPIV